MLFSCPKVPLFEYAHWALNTTGGEFPKDKLNENLVPGKLSLELERSIQEVNLVPRVDKRRWEQMEMRYHCA